MEDGGQGGGGKKYEVTGRLSGNPTALERRCEQHQIGAKGNKMQ